jgi:hypothetical protein
MIQDISDCTTTEIGKKILTNIKITMSDRAATEKKFHELLKDYREEILPSVHSGRINWRRERINNYHEQFLLWPSYFSKGEESLGAEAQPETKQFTEKGESGTVRLVRTACKCFVRGADDKSGCYSDFKTFLSSMEVLVKKHQNY